MKIKLIIEKLINRLATNEVSFLVMGDTIVDREFLLQSNRKIYPSLSTAPFYSKVKESLGFGGSIKIASELSRIGNTKVIEIIPGRGELLEFYNSMIKQSMENLEILPVSIVSSSLNEITRICTTNIIEKKKEILKFQENKFYNYTEGQIFEINNHLKNIRKSTILVLIDFDKGFFSNNLIALLNETINTQQTVILKATHKLYKFQSIKLHTAYLRLDQLQSCFEYYENYESILDSDSIIQKCFSYFPNFINIVLKDHANSDVTIFQNKNLNLKSTTAKSNSPNSILRMGGGIVFTLYYTIALSVGMDPSESTLIGQYASFLHPRIKDSRFPDLDDLIENIEGYSYLSLDLISSEKLSLSNIILTQICAFEGLKINYRDYATKLKKTFTKYDKFSKTIDEITNLILSIYNQKNNPCASFLIHGKPGCGKGYFIDDLIKFIQTNSKLCYKVLKYVCTDFSIEDDQNFENPSQIIVDISREKNVILFLDEIDKFQGSVAKAQGIFLDSFNSGIFNNQFVNVIIVAATSSNFTNDIDSGIQLRDFYRRFPKKFYIPTINERKVDIPILTAKYLLDETNYKGLTVNSLRKLIDMDYDSFQDFFVTLDNYCNQTMDNKILNTSSDIATENQAIIELVN